MEKNLTFENFVTVDVVAPSSASSRSADGWWLAGTADALQELVDVPLRIDPEVSQQETYYSTYENHSHKKMRADAGVCRTYSRPCRAPAP